MNFEDKSVKCFDCGETFTFTVAEQQDFQSKGYANAPKRCPACRKARKERQGNTVSRSNMSTIRTERQMFPATCAQCGKQTQVPFEPREGRPVYCRDCYNTAKASR
jgi:CxxC-x17-CxxC domain-containing protein